ncbi:MAG: SDR family NAD(P)-dependent oxidoreductase [Deltaproteobacteria bacterium]|jgi:NAD(P)-dependent dehydrogenase (short-subunit alcohol dehydrogenase family)
MSTTKISLVTGATDGIGVPTAIELARRGHHVILHGRREERLARAEAALRSAVPGASIETVSADLSSLAEVREMGRTLAARHDAIHVLVLNAGVFAKGHEKSRDGYELTLAVNHLAHFALTGALLDRVRAAASRDGHGRVVTVSSIAHGSGVIDLAALRAGGKSTDYEAYAESKLLNVVFAAELARRERAAGSGVTSNSLHPGVLSTKLLRTGFGRGGAPVEEGATTSVFLATDPSVTQTSGAYFVSSRIARHHPSADDPRLGAEVWSISEALVAR